MSKHPFRDSYDNFYIDIETGERAYASDGTWAPIMARVLLLFFVAAAFAMVI